MKKDNCNNCPTYHIKHFSQTTNKLLDSSTVKHQFESLIDKSNNFQGYKVIKTTSLFKLQSNVLDSFLFQKQAFSKRRLSEFSKATY
jgi:hypothetical protein